MPKAKTKKEAKRSYNAFVLNKHKYNIGDPILVQSKAANPFIGEILKIEASPSDSKNVTLSLRWYYRPEVFFFLYLFFIFLFEFLWFFFFSFLFFLFEMH